MRGLVPISTKRPKTSRSRPKEITKLKRTRIKTKKCHKPNQIVYTNDIGSDDTQRVWFSFWYFLTQFHSVHSDMEVDELVQFVYTPILISQHLKWSNYGQLKHNRALSQSFWPFFPSFSVLNRRFAWNLWKPTNRCFTGKISIEFWIKLWATVLPALRKQSLLFCI